MVAMRPPAGRVGRGPGWSPGSELVERNGFPLWWLKPGGGVTFSAACQERGAVQASVAMMLRRVSTPAPVSAEVSTISG